ncbi:uncharacterized protein Tco025E_07160, partial [Trypanosoma conorhini]
MPGEGYSRCSSDADLDSGTDITRGSTSVSQLCSPVQFEFFGFSAQHQTEGRLDWVRAGRAASGPTDNNNLSVYSVPMLSPPPAASPKTRGMRREKSRNVGLSREFLMSMCFISPPCWDGPSLPDGEQTVCDASDSENHDVLDEYGLFAAVADGGKLKPLVPDGPAQKSTRGSVFDIRKANPSPLAAELSLSPSGNQCLRECKERTTAAAAAAGGSENELGNQLVSRERAQQKSPESRCGLELATCPCSAPSRKNLAEQPSRKNLAELP